MSSTQGIQSVVLPEAIKNAMELAQNRLSLLAGDEDRLRKLKLSLETEVSSIAQDRALREKECKDLDTDIADKKSSSKNLDVELEDKAIKASAKVNELKEVIKKIEKANLELVGLLANNKAASEKLLEATTSLEGVNIEIENKKNKITIFTQAISNLL